MAGSDFFSDETRRAVGEAVAAAESTTAAEVVVALRHQAGNYRHADYLLGVLAALATLLVLLFHPRPFRVATMPLDVAIAFGLGAAACAYSPGLRRLFTSASLRRKNLEQAAKAAFVDLGVSCTRGRTGILILVATLERDAAVVTDIGVDAAAMGPAWTAAVDAVRAAAARLDAAAFLTAIRGLGAPLGAALPRQADDVNELPDAPTAE